MSDNIRGITFAEQAVTPTDDAIVRRAILGDGILSGCDVSYSGSTLTMASGYIIACGRAFQVTAAQNWPVVDATSGFARLLLTIDLTKTATMDAFEQISSSIEYASARDGFPALRQDDINISGTKYQIVAAVVSLGAGGITGIVSKLDKAEGGGNLNFKIAGNPQPADPKENTIWLNTDVPITAWHFQAEQPDNLDDGDVWFLTGASSLVAFNALKRNGIVLYPISAKQFVSGELMPVDAKMYRNGVWMELEEIAVSFCDNFIPTRTLLDAGITITRNTYETTSTGGYYGIFTCTLNDAKFEVDAIAAGEGECRIDFPFSCFNRNRLVATGTTQKAYDSASDVTVARLSVNVLDEAGNKLAVDTFEPTVKGTTEKFSITIDLSDVSVETAYISIGVMRNGNYASYTAFEDLYIE